MAAHKDYYGQTANNDVGYMCGSQRTAMHGWLIPVQAPRSASSTWRLVQPLAWRVQQRPAKAETGQYVRKQQQRSLCCSGTTRCL